MARFERAALTAFSLSKSVRLALAKDHNPGPAIERPREQHPLLLATGEGRHVPDQALVAHRHAFDVIALQQAVILRDEGDLASEALGVPAGLGLAVDVDVAVVGFVEPCDHLEVAPYEQCQETHGSPKRLSNSSIEAVRVQTCQPQPESNTRPKRESEKIRHVHDHRRPEVLWRHQGREHDPVRP